MIFICFSAITAAQAQQAPAADSAQDLSFWEELAFWEAVKDSTTADELEAYLDAYPDGRFAALAKVRVARLQREAVAGDKPAESPPKPADKPAPPPPATPPASTASTASQRAQPPAKSKYYIASTNSNVRAGPNTSAQVIGTVGSGKRIMVFGKAPGSDWFRVKLDDGRSGFVYAPLLTPEQAEVSAPESESTGQLTSGEVFRDCSVCPSLVVVPAGQFEMGSSQRKDEGPVRTVTVDQPFAIGVFEVSNAEWSLCVSDNACGYTSPEQNADIPIANLSWDDTEQYLQWLSGKTGQTYRLPSEAEWEYAARGGTTTTYWWGDEVGRNRAVCKNCGSQWDNRQPAPTGTFAGNGFGLYDVHGNVWEWTADCWNASYRNAPSTAAPWLKGDCLARVLRGGSWKQEADYMRTARRSKYDRDVRYLLNGFRVARDLR